MSGDRRDGDAGPAASFVRGMTIGALLGAAIAGSSLWSRRRRARQARLAAIEGEAVRIDPGPSPDDRPSWPDDRPDPGPRPLDDRPDPGPPPLDG